MLLFLYLLVMTIFLLYGLYSILIISISFFRKKIKHDCFSSAYTPYVTIQLPVYNEPNVARQLIESVTEMNYPKELMQILVLDDSNDETTSILREVINQKKASGFDIEIIRRETRSGFKAGALQNSMAFTKGDFIAIFDADFRPDPQFLIKTLPYFKNPTVGNVQTRWDYLNTNESILTKMQSMSLNGHFSIEQNARNNLGLLTTFNGSAGVWRKSTITETGGWHSDTLAEDLDISIRAQLKGWKMVFLNQKLSKSLLPENLNDIKSQQFRWTKGNSEAFLKNFKSILTSPIGLFRKIELIIHLQKNYLQALILIFSLINIPIIKLFIYNPASEGISVYMNFFIITLIGSLLYFISSQDIKEKSKLKAVLYFPIYISSAIGLSFSNTLALVESIFKSKSAFVRTPKVMNSSKSSIKSISYYRNYKIFFELLMGFYYLISVALISSSVDIVTLSFLIIFMMGFLCSGLLSLIENLLYYKAGRPKTSKGLKKILTFK